MMIDTEEDKSKFEVLYEKYKNLMYAKAKEILKDTYLAEDAVNEAFMKIADNIDKIGEADSKETKNYIMVINKNTALDVYRKRKRDTRLEMPGFDEEKEDAYIINEGKDLSDILCTENQVLKVIRELPEKYKEVFLLKYVNNLGNAQIAKSLNISEEAVRQRISRGRNIIEKKLEGIQ